MKHAVTSYSFAQLLDTGAMSLAQAIVRAAAMGFEGFEFAGFREQNYGLSASQAHHICQSEGLEICGYMTCCDFLQPADNQLDGLLREIDVAAGMGAHVLRTDILSSRTAPVDWTPMVEALRHAAGYALKAGVKLVTENHGGYFCLSDRLERLILSVGHENFGLLFDQANFADADEDPSRAMSRLSAYVRHVHMKDAHLKNGRQLYPGDGWYVTSGGNYLRCAITGHGDLPTFEILKVLSQIGYSGYLVQEFEGVEDCLYALKSGLKNTKRFLELVWAGVWPGTQ